MDVLDHGLGARVSYIREILADSEKKDVQLRNIVHKRVLPGLLLVDAEGQLLFWNSTARQILLPDGHYAAILRQIRERLVSLNKTRSQVSSTGGSSKDPLLQELLCSRGGWYGLQAFWLDDHSNGHTAVVAVLLEAINPSRMDLHRARRLFNLSPRELDAIKALQVGMTDKEIAMALQVSPETARGYLKTIRAKMGVTTRTAVLHKLLSL